MKQNCIRCKGKLGLLVELSPISKKEFVEKGVYYKHYKYSCSCGCSFERTARQ